ncbi:FmdB family zinc ribbon protein [Burkholderia alba]|uniref:FmdB family zinc ribbon protein n=1 Tax=Burkholderia alba TaxID=2683677 RepID=UPI002B052198|nr:FmdB family zinc ribbon protein [Burkholderia alba]
MPIYAYRCDACGYAKDVLQKMSDAPLSQCPECGKDAFRKQVTAAGFQLKGSGWYVTDFRGGAAAASSTASGSEAAPAAPASAPAETAAPAASAGDSAATSPAAAAAPAAGAPASSTS